MTSLEDKLVYGSDASPTFTHRFQENLEAVRALRIDETARDKILWRNAAKLLKLPGV
ncbi:MAG: hypothetical protein HY660_08095 [Armatimonadetes bacterium]|nr:hypothetical protein [Armatimonadota bacterium]